MRVAALGVAAVAGAAGCGTGERDSGAAAVVARFHAALEQRDGEGACAELSEETESKLEQQEGRPCPEAILGLELPRGGTPAQTSVYVTSASVLSAEGEMTFLDEAADGWEISAAGCERSTPDLPYDCKLEG